MIATQIRAGMSCGTRLETQAKEMLCEDLKETGH